MMGYPVKHLKIDELVKERCAAWKLSEQQIIDFSLLFTVSVLGNNGVSFYVMPGNRPGALIDSEGNLDEILIRLEHIIDTIFVLDMEKEGENHA